MFQPYVRAIHMELNTLIWLIEFESITEGCNNIPLIAESQ